MLYIYINISLNLYTQNKIVERLRSDKRTHPESQISIVPLPHPQKPWEL